MWLWTDTFVAKFGLTTEYRANFLGIFVGVAPWLGGSVVLTNEPPSRRATKLYNLD